MKYHKKTSVAKLRRYYVIKSLPMDVHIAQNSAVVRLQNFVNASERQEIMDVVAKSQLPAYTSNYEEDLNSEGDPIHTTMYLQTDDIFERELHWLFKRLLTHIRNINQVKAWGFDIGARSSFNVRVAEYHEMFVGGLLSDSHHYDIGSLITVDIMLEEAVEGALFQTLEAAPQNCKIVDRKQESDNGENSEILLQHEFHAGDAIVFVSHKYHCVSQLIKGRRKVLVVEFWSGKKRTCGHRCDNPTKSCSFVAE